MKISILLFIYVYLSFARLCSTVLIHRHQSPTNLANRFLENVVNLVIVSKCVTPIYKNRRRENSNFIPDLEKYGVRIVSAV